MCPQLKYEFAELTGKPQGHRASCASWAGRVITGAHPIIRSEKERSVVGIYRTVIIGGVSVKLPKSVRNFLFSEICITGRAPICTQAKVLF